MAVTLEREGGVGVIVLDRPPANSYDYDFLRQFGSAIDDARVADGICAVVVTSALEKFFSAGADVAAFQAGTANHRSMTALLAHEVFRKMENTPFAVEGRYQLGLPEVNLGLFPGSGGTQRLPRIVGLSRGIDMIVNARTQTPAEAKESGLVDRLFPDSAACRAGAIEYAPKLAEGPSEAIGHAKVAASLGFTAPLDLGLAIEREAIARVFVSDDAHEGIAAFTEKRKPAFKGR